MLKLSFRCLDCLIGFRGGKMFRINKQDIFMPHDASTWKNILIKFITNGQDFKFW